MVYGPLTMTSQISLVLTRHVKGELLLEVRTYNDVSTSIRSVAIPLRLLGCLIDAIGDTDAAIRKYQEGRDVKFGRDLSWGWRITLNPQVDIRRWIMTVHILSPTNEGIQLTYDQWDAVKDGLITLMEDDEDDNDICETCWDHNCK